MLRTTAIAKELAVIERKLQETTNKTLKDALKKKQARLKDELNDYKKSTPALAKQLLAQRAQIKQLSKVDFNDLIRRLSKKPEYSFLRTMSKSTIKTDIERPAKPVGWRFKGRGNYDKPTLAEIKKGKRNGTVYREVRPLRSDVSQPLRLQTGGGIERKKKITLNLDSLTDSTYFNSSYGTFRYGYNDVDVVVNMVNKEYGYAKMKGKFAVIHVEGEWIEGRALNKLIFNTKEEAVNYIKDKLTDEDNKFGQGGNMKNTHMMKRGGVFGSSFVPNYPSFSITKGVPHDGNFLSPGYYTYMNKEVYGKGLYMNVNNRQTMGFSIDDLKIIKRNNPDSISVDLSNLENGGKMENGGIIGQEIVFDDNGEQNTGVIKDIHEVTGNYIVATDDGRTVLADKEMDVISLGKIREPKSAKRFSLFEDGGNIAKENNEMLHSQAKEAKHHIEELHNILTSKTKVEPWVVAKMTRAKTDLSDITHYLDGNTSKMAKGGKLTDSQQAKFDKVMHEWKQGKLHSGSAKGPIVKDQDQAIAIAYSEAYGMDKMLFGGMVNELSDAAIDRMEGLAPISTLEELLDNAKYIIADMENEGFEKDEVMSFLAYKISQIGGGNMMQSVSQVQPWTIYDENALHGWIMDIQDGFGWITPGYVESSWTSRPGSGTKEWNGDIQQRVYKRLIDENMLFAENPNDSLKKGKKIKDVTTAIWTAAEENGYERGGKMATGGGVDDCTASYEMFVEFVESSNDEYVQDANIVPYLEMNGVVVSYKQGSKKVAVIVYNPRKEKLSRASVISSVMTMFPKEVQANIGNFSSKYSLKNKNLCSATLIKIVNHNGELIEEFEEFMNGGKMSGWKHRMKC